MWDDDTGADTDEAAQGPTTMPGEAPHGNPMTMTTIASPEPARAADGSMTTMAPLSDCALATDTMTPFDPYCSCGPNRVAGITVTTEGTMIYPLCADDPYPTIATSTVDPPGANR